MKKKLKQLLILTLIVLIILIAYFCFKAFTVEKQRIDIKYSSSVSTKSPLEAIVKVIDQNGNTKKSNLSLQLLDNNNKRVKGVKGKYHVNEGEEANCSFVIPENLESGNYNLRIKARSGLITTKKEVSIIISNSNNSETIISLDKGIYKPGDTIKYRVLLIKKSDNTPKDSNEVLVEILDGNGNRVYSENSTTTEFGIVAGKFTLASEVNSGTYTISVSSESKKVNKTFTVNPYVTPKFEVKIDTDKDVYQVGETANITFNAKYFFGEPVANANVTGKIGKTEIAGLTDESGSFTYSYEMESTGEREIQVSVTDNSNYLIEANKAIYAQKYVFEVETIFENGMINKNIDNDVYLFAKKIDGTPVKVHATVTIDNITRQVITDENGIGKFTLTSYDTAGFYSNTDYKIVAEDNEGNKYSNEEQIEVVSNSVAIKTDKIKYNQGDDIKIDLNSINDSANRTILVCKNGEIKKILSTNLGTATVNLGDLSGIVDIFVEGKSKNNNSYYDYWDYDYIPSSNYSNYVRKTIFIKPSKALNIEVSTDKEEYKPGENLKLSFKVQDEGKENVDTNLLVSILDEAVLSLANNDLSIDNIRLALNDIELTDEISAADLYADILDNKSESRLMLALLRNNSSAPNLKENKTLDKYSEDYMVVVFALIVAFIVTLLIFLSIVNSKKVKIILMDLINIIVITVLLIIIIYSEFLYYNDEIYSIIISIIITFILYCLILYKKRENIFSLIKDLIVIPGVYISFLYLIWITFDYYDFYLDEEFIGIVGALIIPIIMTVLIVISRKHKLNKFWNIIKNFTIKCTLVEISYLLALLVIQITFENLICFIICFIVIYLLLRKVYNLKVTNKKLNINVNSIQVNEIFAIFISTLVCVIFIIIILYISNSSQNSLAQAAPQFADDSFSSTFGSNDMRDYFDIVPFNDYSAASQSSASKGSGILDKFSDKSNSYVQTEDEEISETIYEENETIEDVENNTNNETTTKVRKVFLESLAFIPNLVVENGGGSTQIELSDNITTWNIQVVGNTKKRKHWIFFKVIQSI